MTEMVPGVFPKIHEDTEVEAKFLVPDLKRFEHLRALAGRKLAGWNVFFRYESLFIDEYYDDNDFGFDQQDQVLRARRRFRDTLGLEPRDARLQRKGPTKRHGPIFFRRELRGPKVKKSERWDDRLTEGVAPGSDTRREFELEFHCDPEAILLPKVEVCDIRHRLYLEKDGLLQFEISLDRLQAVRTDDRRAFVFGYECEVESIAENTTETLTDLVGLSDVLSDRFELLPSPASKYRRALDALYAERD